MHIIPHIRLLPQCAAILLAAGVVGLAGMAAFGQVAVHDGASATEAPSAAIREVPISNPKLDRSGHRRIGKASFYAKRFAGKKMADGTPMHPHADNAASKTLPLGTTAKVTNLATGQSAVVTIRDRGPYVKGRIVDLSPATAQKIGIDHQTGVARVEVSPIAVPLADGSVKAGAAAPVATDARLSSGLGSMSSAPRR
jgi:rare lipoprotein A